MMTGEMQTVMKLFHEKVQAGRGDVEQTIIVLGVKMLAEGLSDEDQIIAITAANAYHHALILDFIQAMADDITRLTTEIATLKGQVAKMQEERG